MEAKTLPNCELPSTGSVFYQDDWNVIYRVDWETVNGLLDITTVTESPVVFDGRTGAFFVGRTLYRLGTITVHRQVIRIEDDAFVIVSEGFSQIVDYYQANFVCEPGPVDNFCYHLDCGISDEIELPAQCGPVWTDPDDFDVAIVWGDVTTSGEVVTIGGLELFQWDDVWTHDIDMTGVNCDATGAPGIAANLLDGLILWLDISQETGYVLNDLFDPEDFSVSNETILPVINQGYYDPDGLGAGYPSLALKEVGSGNPVGSYVVSEPGSAADPKAIDLDTERFTIVLAFGEVENSSEAILFRLSPEVGTADVLTISASMDSPTSGDIYVRGIDGDLLATYPYDPSSVDKHIVALRFDGTFIYISFNGEEDVLFEFDDYILYEAIGLTAYLGSTSTQAEVSELVIYDQFRSNVELNGIVAEIANKYGMVL